MNVEPLFEYPHAVIGGEQGSELTLRIRNTIDFELVHPVGTCYWITRVDGRLETYLVWWWVTFRQTTDEPEETD